MFDSAQVVTWFDDLKGWDKNNKKVSSFGVAIGWLPDKYKGTTAIVRMFETAHHPEAFREVPIAYLKPSSRADFAKWREEHDT